MWGIVGAMRDPPCPPFVRGRRSGGVSSYDKGTLEMSHKLRFRSGQVQLQKVAVASATVITAGDLVYSDTNEAKPASTIAAARRSGSGSRPRACRESVASLDEDSAAGAADSLGDDAHVIYVGDLNLYSASEAAFQTMVAPGSGQAFDPLGAAQAREALGR